MRTIDRPSRDTTRPATGWGWTSPRPRPIRQPTPAMRRRDRRWRDGPVGARRLRPLPGAGHRDAERHGEDVLHAVDRVDGQLAAQRFGQVVQVALVAPRQDDVRDPARWAASTFSLIPPTGSTLPRSVISPVIAMSSRTGRPGRAARRAPSHRDAGRRAVLGHAPRPARGRGRACRGTRRVDAEPLGRRADVGVRGLRRLAHHVAQLPVRISDAPRGSGIIGASTNSTSPPAGVQASPVATPGRSIALRRPRRRSGGGPR